MSSTSIYIVGKWDSALTRETRAIAYSGKSEKPSAMGKVTQPTSTPSLSSGAVEGALFQATLNPNEDSRGGGGYNVQWMIDPQYSFLGSKGTIKPRRDTVVGWAIINSLGLPPDSKSYEVYPVLASDGSKLGNGQQWYIIQKPGDSKL